MAAQSAFNFLNLWAGGDRPGAGDQDKDSNGINGNWWKIGEKLNVLFQLPMNMLRPSIIGALQLKSDVADGVTLEQDGTTKKLRVKDGGITASKLAAGAFSGATMPHDNTRTKIALVFGIDGGTNYGTIGTFVTTLTVGVPMRLAGCITGVSGVTATGAVLSKALAYSSSNANHFAVGSRITVFNAAGTIHWYINGVEGSDVLALGADAKIVTLDIEFD